VTVHVHECDAPPAVEIGYGEAHQLLTALEQAASHLAAVDASNAAANLSDVRHRPLTRLVQEARELLDKLLHDTPSTTGPSAGGVTG
jgi:hypothetical protein